MVYEKIEAKLINELQPSYLSVENESNRHNVPPGSETHFKIIIVSDKFNGERLLKRHQMVYKVLADELATKVHAIALHTYTGKEWQYLKETPPVSPPCRGGGSSSVKFV